MGPPASYEQSMYRAVARLYHTFMNTQYLLTNPLYPSAVLHCIAFRFISSLLSALCGSLLRVAAPALTDCNKNQLHACLGHSCSPGAAAGAPGKFRTALGQRRSGQSGRRPRRSGGCLAAAWHPGGLWGRCQSAAAGQQGRAAEAAYQRTDIAAGAACFPAMQCLHLRTCEAAEKGSSCCCKAPWNSLSWPCHTTHHW